MVIVEILYPLSSACYTVQEQFCPAELLTVHSELVEEDGQMRRCAVIELPNDRMRLRVKLSRDVLVHLISELHNVIDQWEV